MKTFKNFLTEATGKNYYHVTFASNANKIKSKGILLLQTSNWVTSTGSRYNEDGGIFAFESPIDAYRWAFKMNWELKKPIVIIKIKKSKQWFTDPSSDITLRMGEGKALKSQKPVPPKDIIGVVKMEDIPTMKDAGGNQDEWHKMVTRALQ